MVRLWDDFKQKAVTRFLAMPVCNISTAEALFNAIENELESHNIPWENVVGYASDNASVMVGVRNSEQDHNGMCPALVVCVTLLLFVLWLL